MKKTIFVAFTLLFASNLFACHILPNGTCGDSAYFKTDNFYNGSILECRYQGGDGTIIYSRTMPDTGNTDKLYAIPYPIGGAKFGLEWHYYYQGAWTDWLTDSSINTDLCKLLPISFTNFSAIKSGENLKINFRNEDETNVDHYNILVSKDGIEWKTLPDIKATGQHSYTISYNLDAMATGAAFGLCILFVGFKRRRLLYYLSVISLIFFFSCKKDMTESKIEGYHYSKVQPVSKDGGFTNSKVIRF